VYFVSNGGEAFPNLVIVLQGDGVTVDLTGDTYISKTGITSTTFKAVPDDPFNTFEITLAEGPYSALAANGNLCAPTKTVTVKKKVKVKTNGHTHTITRKTSKTEPATLTIPGDYHAQDGALYTQDTKITVTGCPKPHKAKAKHKAKKGRK
jgi:hypothetical protein